MHRLLRSLVYLQLPCLFLHHLLVGLGYRFLHRHLEGQVSRSPDQVGQSLAQVCKTQEQHHQPRKLERHGISLHPGMFAQQQVPFGVSSATTQSEWLAALWVLRLLFFSSLLLVRNAAEGLCLVLRCRKVLEVAFRHFAFQINSLPSINQILLNSGRDITMKPVRKSEVKSQLLICSFAAITQLWHCSMCSQDMCSWPSPKFANVGIKWISARNGLLTHSLSDFRLGGSGYSKFKVTPWRFLMLETDSSTSRTQKYTSKSRELLLQRLP